jgi:CrcB protein
MFEIVIICIFACLGALTRWQLGVLFNALAPIPMGTLACNLIGGYLVGVCVGVFNTFPQIDPIWRLALVTGFMGSLTTFSSFSAEVITMISNAKWFLALGTIGIHLFGSLILTFLGIKTVSTMVAQMNT